jgi:hypothetical protein
MSTYAAPSLCQTWATAARTQRDEPGPAHENPILPDEFEGREGASAPGFPGAHCLRGRRNG